MSGIYIHIPFCKQACTYCDFHFSTLLRRKEDMMEALHLELELRNHELTDQIQTIYFGGGTPSILDASEIEALLQSVQKNYSVENSPEITLEANPDDLNLIKIRELAAIGVNRLSIGVQSFFEQDLQFMNRAHNADEALRSVEQASAYFENISIDLIYGLPRMSSDRWRTNLSRAFELGVVHLSSYALTVEHGTALNHLIEKGKYPPLSEEQARLHFEILREEAAGKGYIQYETSNFAKEGYFSRHNTSYWQGLSFLGIGPSAHSYDGGSRSWNVSNNAKYIRALQSNKIPRQIERLEEKDRLNEYLMTGLRTIWGVSLKRLAEEYGTDILDRVLIQAQRHLEQGTLRREGEHLYVTESGQFLADGISADLFLVD